MKNVTADSAKNTTQKPNGDRRICGDDNLAACGFGQIGISAVAAAARYQGSAKNPAYAPASSTWRDRIAEAAA